jgi:hypothetical protein
MPVGGEGREQDLSSPSFSGAVKMGLIVYHGYIFPVLMVKTRAILASTVPNCQS